jgi:hypothetical protein
MTGAIHHASSEMRHWERSLNMCNWWISERMGQAEWLVETQLWHTFVDDRNLTGFSEYLYVFYVLLTVHIDISM